MYIKRLKIESKDKIIREIQFKNGLNLIVDNTPINLTTETGNNVGKTTVLKLIDFCLGGKADKITKDKESKNILYDIKDFLINEEVVVTLIISNSFTTDKNDIKIRRNFLNRNKKILEINGKKLTQNGEKLFINKLSFLLFGERLGDKPSLRSLLAHSIRYSDERISNTLRMLNNHTTLSEYETLFLFMFGFNSLDRTELIKKLKLEENFKNKLLGNKDKIQLNFELNIIEINIEKLLSEKKLLLEKDNDKNYEYNIQQINLCKLEINKISSKISELELKKELLYETKTELEQSYSYVGIELIKNMYDQATKFNLINIQKNFEDIVKYHNEMILEKIRFVTYDIPSIKEEILDLEKDFKVISDKKKILESKIKMGNSLKELEEIITRLNEEYRKKGEIEKLLDQIEEVEDNINKINTELESFEGDIFTDDFQEKLKERLTIFNRYFSRVSEELYNEHYGITYDIVKDKKSSKNVYRFKCFNNNTSSGKKQGEIICFDLAYILFARDYKIPHVNFILNDKKELMFGTQLVKLSKFAEDNNIQLVFSILKDKLPNQLNNNDNIIIELSQDDKLFRIENGY